MHAPKPSLLSNLFDYLKALPSGRFILLFVLIAVVISEALTIAFSLKHHGEIVPGILLVNFVSPALFGFIVSSIAAIVLKKLKHSEERFALAMRGANDGLWDWDLETNTVFFSPRWKSMLGYENHELPNRLETWKSLVHPKDREPVLQKVDDYLSHRIDSYEVEMRLRHKEGHMITVLSRAFRVNREADGRTIRLVGTHVDISARKKAEAYSTETANILKMIAMGHHASEIYDAIALMYERRHPGMRCSMLELEGNRLLHGGAPSLPEEYCEAVHGLENGPNVGSCGTSTYTGKRCLVENIETDPKWEEIKHVALPHGMRCCWSEPIKSSSAEVLGAFGMYYDYPALPDEQESNDLVAAARLAGIVMERDHAQKRIRQLAYTDELTGLASRAHFYLTLEDLIKISGRHNRRFSLLYIDLDDFKNVNDSLGHDVGDLLLQEFARRLGTVGRETDFISRLGGDEFCILLEDLESELEAGQMAQRVLDALAQPVELYARKLTPTCSVGIAHYPEDGKTPSDLIKAADTALYDAKERGKNRYAFYQSELTRKAEYRFQFEQALREAIEKKELTLAFQPKVEIDTGQIIGVEALCRWNHAHLGQVPPLEFISVAERIGMIKPLTEWVLYSACREMTQWQKAGLPTVRMAVNISPCHFRDKDLVALVKGVIEETGVTPGDLELEVTEGTVQTHPENLAIIRDLKNYGLQLAIDDFGTGYSSLASLKHLKIDTLKIDRHFIDDMLTDQQSLILIRSMIEMGHNLGYGIVAEGVETAEQLKVLKKLGCETAQGYLFSKPVSAREMTALLGQSRTASS